MTNSFIDTAGKNITAEDAKKNLMDNMKTFTIYFCGFGAGAFILSYLRYALLTTVSYRICIKVRSKLFSRILHKDISWYDVNEIGELNSRLTE